MLLTTLDRAFTAATLRGETAAGRLSWRAGRWTRRTLASAHETFLRVGVALGGADVAWGLVETIRTAHVPVVPALPALGLPEPPDAQLAALGRGEVILPDGSVLPLEQVSWLRDPFGMEGPSYSTRFLFHCLDWVSRLADEAAQTGQAALLARAREIADQWMAECLYAERREKIWDDHITAIRAVVLCRLWTAVRTTDGHHSTFLRRLIGALVRHADKLGDGAFYRAEHNHGVTQAYALLALGLTLAAHPRARRWVELGRRRLEEQIARNVSEDGGHREHSPYYHFYVLKQFNDAARLAAGYGCPLSPGFVDRLRAMLVTGTHMLKPDGGLPALGDTSIVSPVLVRGTDFDGWPEEAAARYRYAATAGVEGRAPGERSVVIPGAGYAFLRSGWGQTESARDERYLAVRTATYPTSHIHRDALSFELYGYGDDLIVDSGGPFAYGDPARERFFLTTRAHNTVVVDDGEQRVAEGAVLLFRSIPSCDALVVEHQGFPEVRHRRAFLFVRGAYLVVLDALFSSAEHRYEQLFHLAPALAASAEGHAVATRRAGPGPTVRIVPLTPEGLHLGLTRGVEQPLQGWVCVGERRMVENTVATYRREGGSVGFATVLVPERAGRTSRVEGRVEGVPLATDLHLSVMVDGRRDEITLSARGNLTMRSEEP